MIFWLATTNKNKIKEIKLCFKSFYRFYDISHLKNYTPPEETGSTFKENAKIKTESLTRFLSKTPSIPIGFENSGSYRREKTETLKQDQYNCLILGEDSGLEVHSLNGEPGIYSARYSGFNDKQNNQLLLKNMNGRQNRRARYVCVICCLFKRQQYFFEGELKGSIAFEERGANGFGYDPLFVPKGEKKTLGELSPDFKQMISHRAKAVNKLKDFLLKKIQ